MTRFLEMQNADHRGRRQGSLRICQAVNYTPRSGLFVLSGCDDAGCYDDVSRSWAAIIGAFVFNVKTKAYWSSIIGTSDEGHRRRYPDVTASGRMRRGGALRYFVFLIRSQLK